MEHDNKSKTELLDDILEITKRISIDIKQPDQFTKITEIELAVHEARKTFEQEIKDEH